MIPLFTFINFFLNLSIILLLSLITGLGLFDKVWCWSFFVFAFPGFCVPLSLGFPAAPATWPATRPPAGGRARGFAVTAGARAAKAGSTGKPQPHVWLAVGA